MGIQSKWKMPPILNHRKVKRATVLSKRIQYMRSYANRNKCYKPLYEKLRINNIYLARALSKKKQESQSLFSQNVALLAEVQDLGLACNKRNNALIGILKNAKEMLRMLVTVTGYVTNTIASCQEFVSSFDNNAQVSHNLAARKDSCRRLSVKSPAKGIVKPMVSGHTITKPTINLSRLNMQHIPKLANLSTIMEAAVTPNRNQQNRQGRRMPERITIASPRPSDESERRLSNRSRHSGRMSGRYSRSNSGRFSGHRVTRHSTEHAEHVGSPRVELNDVSKLLRNSHTVNLRMLTQNENNCVNESIDHSDSMHNNSESDHLKLSSTQISDDTIASENESKNATSQLNNNSTKQIDKGNGDVYNKSADFDDPLEGPSWLFNDSADMHLSNGTENKTDCDNNSNDTFNTSSRPNKTYNVSDNMDKSEQISDLPDLTNSVNRTQDFEVEDSVTSINVGRAHDAELQREESNSLCAAPSDSIANTVQSEYRDEEDATVNFTRFITKRRGPSPNINDDSDDFTLMFMRPPNENVNFDINDLRLPVLEQSVIRTTVAIELEPEITTTVQRISENRPMLSLVNNGINESLFDNSTIKLPIISNTDDNREYASTKDEQLCLRKKQKKDTGESVSAVQNTLIDKKLASQSKKSVNDKDPSTAKVVLEKLNDSRVCQSCTPFEAQHLRDSTEFFSRKSLTSINDIENLSDSESSNASTSSRTAHNRPKRRKAPVNLREPKLNTKLRRKC